MIESENDETCNKGAVAISWILQYLFVAFAEYILMKPSDEYSSFMDAVIEKIYMSKVPMYCFY